MKKAIVYLKTDLSYVSGVKQIKERVKIFCKENNFSVAEIIIDNFDEDNFEDLICYCEDKSNEIYNVITINLNMIGKDIYDIYDRYVYLRDYCHCNLISIEDPNYQFKIELLGGEDSE